MRGVYSAWTCSGRQTHRLNGAWSWQLFWTDAVRWGLPPLSFVVTWVPAKELPRLLLTFLAANSAATSKSFSHHLYIKWLCFCVPDMDKYILLKNNVATMLLTNRRSCCWMEICSGSRFTFQWCSYFHRWKLSFNKLDLKECKSGISLNICPIELLTRHICCIKVW